jgi:hypothetical protein
MVMNRKLVATVVGAVLVIAPVSALASTQRSTGANGQAGAPTTANWQVPLRSAHAYPRVTGSAQYQSQPGQRELQVELGRLASLHGSQLLVRVNGANVGWMKVSGRGVAQLTRNSELGQQVPSIVHGSTVTVTTRAGGLVSSGCF